MQSSSIRTSFFTRLPSSIYLWLATLIFAASGSVTRRITEIGAAHLVNGRNPISLCNVLLAGNLCALAVMLLIFAKQWNRQTFRQLTHKNWISLGIIAVLSGAVGPGLIFAALSHTNVTSVILVGRLEPPLTLILSVLLLKVRVNPWVVAGSAVAFIGVTVTALLTSSSQSVSIMGGLFQIGQGELQVAIASFVLAVATVISKAQLQHIPFGVFNIIRVGVGTIIFFLLANILYGSHHFNQIFSPFLWRWMLLYGSVIVVAGQLCWFAGLRGSMSSEVALASSFNPVAAVIMSYFILGEVPTFAQYFGGAIILIGIFLNLIGSLQADLRQRRLSLAQQLEMMTGFRGV